MPETTTPAARLAHPMLANGLRKADSWRTLRSPCIVRWVDPVTLDPPAVLKWGEACIVFRPQPGVSMSKVTVLTEEFIASQRSVLEALRAELMDAEDAARTETNDLQTEGGSEPMEFEDVAQTLDRKDVLQAKHEVDLQRLARIERALKKIELGTYGLSDASGKPIPKSRLEVLPEAVLTVEEAEAKR